MRFFRTIALSVLVTTLSTTNCWAGDHVLSTDHAPLGVMGDHLHETGEVMLSYRFMHMGMAGNRIGDSEVSPETITTTVPNRFFGRPMQPPTLRVVPTKMTMQMHMFGVMYAPTDWVTLMAMLNYTEKEMEHITFMGGAGTTRLGSFTTESSGLGDTRLAALIRLFESGNHKAHANLGVSLPTGSTNETDSILTPMGARPNPRLPYAMQLGSGTLDFLPGVTYTGNLNSIGWGAQYAGTIRTEKDNGYQWGDKQSITGWASYAPRHWLSFSTRLEFNTMGKIDGSDSRIVAPVQTADPNNYGGERIDLKLGLNLAGQSDWTIGHRIAIEGGIPVLQDLNGPQMETDYMISVGWQYAF